MPWTLTAFLHLEDAGSGRSAIVVEAGKLDPREGTLLRDRECGHLHPVGNCEWKDCESSVSRV